jgi:hypothetical protein
VVWSSVERSGKNVLPIFLSEMWKRGHQVKVPLQPASVYCIDCAVYISERVRTTNSSEHCVIEALHAKADASDSEMSVLLKGVEIECARVSFDAYLSV